MLVVLWIGHGFKEQVEAGNAADLFLRAGALHQKFWRLRCATSTKAMVHGRKTAGH